MLWQTSALPRGVGLTQLPPPPHCHNNSTGGDGTAPSTQWVHSQWMEWEGLRGGGGVTPLGGGGGCVWLCFFF